MGRLPTASRGGMAQAGRGPEVSGGTQAVGCSGDVQGDRSLRALQPVGRSGGVPASRPPLVHAVSGLGLEDRVPDAKTVWLYREHLAQAGVIGGVVRCLRRLSEEAGLLGDGRPDHRRPRSSRSPNSATAVTRTRGSRMARRRRAGRSSRPSVARRIRTRGGPRSTARAITATRTM